MSTRGRASGRAGGAGGREDAAAEAEGEKKVTIVLALSEPRRNAP